MSWETTWMEELSRIWTRLRNLAPELKDGPPRKREAYELLAAAFIYSRAAVAELRAHGDFHKPAWIDRATESFTNTSLPASPPSFQDLSQWITGTMHLASATFRISTALEVLEGEPDPKKSWLSRGKLVRHLGTVEVLGCRNADTLPPAHEIEVHATILMLHRDEYGHGEEGSSGATDTGWRPRRGSAFKTLCPCSLAESQLFLIQHGVGIVEED